METHQEFELELKPPPELEEVQQAIESLDTTSIGLPAAKIVNQCILKLNKCAQKCLRETGLKQIAEVNQSLKNLVQIIKGNTDNEIFSYSVMDAQVLVSDLVTEWSSIASISAVSNEARQTNDTSTTARSKFITDERLNQVEASITELKRATKGIALDLRVYTEKLEQLESSVSFLTWEVKAKIERREVQPDIRAREVQDNIKRTPRRLWVSEINTSNFIYSYNQNSKQLHSTNIITGAEASHMLPSHTFLSYSSWCDMPGGFLFFTGGQGSSGYTKDAYTVCVNNFEVAPKAQMLIARGKHGSVYSQGFIYVIGGYNPTNLTNCERYVASDNTWEVLPDLPIGNSMMGVIVLDQTHSLYSIGGCYDNSIHELNLDRLEWKTMSFKFPGECVNISCFKHPRYPDKVYFISGSELFSLDPARDFVDLLRNVGRSITCDYGQSQYSKGFLYSSAHNGPTHKLHIEDDSFIENSGKIFSYNQGTGELHWTELETGTPGTQTIPFTFKIYCSWCEVPGGSLLITGGGPSSDVFSIDLRNYSVSIKPQMITARRNHNSIYYRGAVYVIGGWVRECERYLSSRNAWETLPALPAPANSYPLIVIEASKSLYAIGGTINGMATNLIQELDLERLTWRTLRLELAAAQHGLPAFKTSKEAKDLFIVQGGKLFNLCPSENHLFLVRTLTADLLSYFGTSHYSNGIVYGSNYQGPVLKLEIGSL